MTMESFSNLRWGEKGQGKDIVQDLDMVSDVVILVQIEYSATGTMGT